MTNTSRDNPHPRWRFAPNEGGAEQGVNPGQTHFSADAFTNMVREVLQNSLDHHQPGLDGVRVTFRTLSVPAEDIQATQLLLHARASLLEAEAGQNPDTTGHYSEMETALSVNQIPCLAIVDENTTGLQGNNWRNLIFREGMPQNTGKVTKGGSVGLGKHASFNLSACNTVIYSTRYVAKAARGKVCHMAGRSQLMTHADPSGSHGRLRDVGFLGNHQDGGYNEPIRGPDIPEAFRLQNSGTGVFIIGFRRERFPGWVKQATREILRNFFYAIHTGNLEVHLQDQDAGTQSILDQKSLDAEMEQLGEKDPSRQYFQAIRGEPLETNPSGKLGPSRRMMVWIDTNRNAPKKLAHLNRRGMLITDVRRSRENPLMPFGGGSWSPWCAVTMAADEETDRFLRRMEPATHNAIHPGELQDPNEQDDATVELRHHREQIAELIRSRIEQNSTTKSSNITELAELFPNLQIDQGTDMEWQEIESQQEKNQAEELPGQEPDDDNDEGETKTPSGENPSDAKNGSTRKRKGKKTPGETEDTPLLDSSRIIRISPDSFAASFTMPDVRNNTLRFSLRTAGEQHQHNEERVRVRDVIQAGELLATATTQDGDIIVNAPPETHIVLMISTEEPETRYSGYKLTLQDNGKGAS